MTRSNRQEQAMTAKEEMTATECLEESFENFQGQNGDRKLAEWYFALYLTKAKQILTSSANGAIQVYEDGYYRCIGELLIKQEITRHIHQYARRGTIEEILNHVRNLTLTQPDEYQKRQPLNLVPVQNGLFDIDTQKLNPHSPEYYFTWKLPVQYDPHAKCPNINQFLTDVVRPQDIPRLLDLLALGICHKHILEKFFILEGRGKNGKSQFLQLAEAFVGKENISTLSLHQLSTDPFAPANTYGKLMNIGADISHQPITDTGFLKNFTGGERVTVQYKYQQGFDMEPTATLVFSANHPPTIEDNSDGIYRRIETINFPYQFGNDKDCEEDPRIKKATPHIVKTIITPSELSGLLNEVLTHQINIHKQGQLSSPTSTAENKKRYQRVSNSAAVFVEECCEQAEYFAAEKTAGGMIEPEGTEKVTELYKHYVQYCKIMDLQPVNNIWFTRNIVRGLTTWVIETGTKDRFGTWENKQRSVRGLHFVKLPDACSDPVKTPGPSKQNTRPSKPSKNLLSARKKNIEDIKGHTGFSVPKRGVDLTPFSTTNNRNPVFPPTQYNQPHQDSHTQIRDRLTQLLSDDGNVVVTDFLSGEDDLETAAQVIDKLKEQGDVMEVRSGVIMLTEPIGDNE